MRLGLAMLNNPISNKSGKMPRLHSKEIAIINLDTCEQLTDRIGLVWGDKSIFINGPDSILTAEHFEGEPEDASYVGLVFRCDAAINLEN